MVKQKKKISQVKKSRKEIRKEKRNEKKLSKKKFFSSSIKSKNLINKIAIDNPKPKVNKNYSDDEIESDFELNDSEMNEKISKIKSKSKPKKKLETNILDESKNLDLCQEIQKREIKKQKELERKMRKKRLVQLKEANEDEDKIIRKLEKKLKIDKHRNEKSVHKMFTDGLDYALELCLPENIEKMYSAAKEATKLDDLSNDEDDFEEDLIAALGKNELSTNKSKVINKKLKSKIIGQEIANKNSVIIKNQKKQMKKLKKVEQQYFMDSDFSGEDSELENNDEQLSDESKDSEGDESYASDNHDDEETDEDSGKSVSDEENEYDINDLNDSTSETNDLINENHEKKDESNELEKEWEDIYGRKRDSEGNVIQSNNEKYVPPHVRARLEADAVNAKDSKQKIKLARLTKQCKGLLNRLSEANMHKISSEFEQLYMKNSRYDMNNALSDIILDALVSHVLSKNRMVLEYTMLIAILHTNVGSEVGAHFLQTLIIKFDNYLKMQDKLEVEDKELDNTIFVLSHLYTYNIFGHSLIFEIMKRLTLKLSEKSIECLLLILKSIGFQLRKDDPGALKDFILSTQVQAGECNLDIQENPRYKFMLEILNAIKNNNMNKIPNYDPTLAEHLKKILKSFFTNGKYLSTLNVTMQDLLKADEKGKWWVVGSAWSGNVNDIGTSKQNCIKNSEKFSDKLLELARKQRMNTEDRRNVFCIIMSADDYVDSFEKLLNLSLKDHRIISSIIIHCCIAENNFNPYYGALAKKFCEHDRKYQLAIQFATWDRIKDINSINKFQMKNLAKFLTFLIVHGSQPISILKVIEFTELDKTTLRFVRQIILAILLGDETECRQVFERIAPSIKLKNFKDSINLFMNHFLLKGSNENKISNDQINLLKERINSAGNILAYSDSKLKF